MFVVKVPGVNNVLGNTDGCEKSGNEILKRLKEDISFNESGREIDFGKLDLEEIHLDNSDLRLTNKLIYKNSFETFGNFPKVVFLGGDHSVSYSLVRGFFDYCQNSEIVKEPCLIVFDCFADFGKGSSEKGEFANNRNWLGRLLEDGFPKKNVLLVGVRNFTLEEKRFFNNTGIRNMSMNNFLLNLENSCDALMEFSNGKELYVSFDMKVVDPAFAPGVSESESGGFSSRDALYLVQRISKMKNLRGFDLVEINSDNDKNFENKTLKLGAKLLGEIL